MPNNTHVEEDFSWKLLLRRFQKEKTVLLVGPEVIRTGHPQDLKSALQDYIQQDLQGILDPKALKKIEYYSDDGFFYLEDEYRAEVIDSVLEFYEEQELLDIYRKIVQIPFHLIISLSPDKLLCRAMEEEGLPYHFHHYSKKSYNKELDDRKLDFKPSLDNRLIYNIFGCTDEEDSLILSYDDLFEFLQRVFNNYDLPETVREALQDANYYLFVGFKYSKWYLKLLLRLMKMNEKIRKVFGMDQPSRQELATFFINEFDMKFTQKDSAGFIEELYAKCQAEDLLVQPAKAFHGAGRLKAELSQQARTFLQQSQTREALDLLQADGAENPTFLNALTLISGRYQSLEKDNRDGILDYGEYTRQKNKLNRDLLDLLHEYA